MRGSGTSTPPRQTSVAGTEISYGYSGLRGTPRPFVINYVTMTTTTHATKAALRQTRLPIDWLVEAEESSSSSEEAPVEVRRRKARPLQWTRVKSAAQMREQRLTLYDGDKDLVWDKNLKTIRKEANRGGGEFVFDPDSLREEAKGFTVEAYRLGQDVLLEYGKLATRLRADFKAKSVAQQQAGAEDDQDEEVELPHAAINLRRGTKKSLSAEKEEAAELAFEQGCHGRRRRKRRKHDLSALQLQRIAKLVLEEGLSQAEAAALCNVKAAMVSGLVKKVKQAKRSYAAVTEYRDSRAAAHQDLVDKVRAYVERGQHVWTAQQVRLHLQETLQREVALGRVRRILRHDLGMRYRVLKKVAYQGNSERCLVTRMLYAKQMFELLRAGKRVVNIDETWLPHLDFRNKKWRARGEQNTVSAKALGHRVNMIAALDTDGRLYLSLT